MANICDIPGASKRNFDGSRQRLMAVNGPTKLSQPPIIPAEVGAVERRRCYICGSIGHCHKTRKASLMATTNGNNRSKTPSIEVIVSCDKFVRTGGRSRLLSATVFVSLRCHRVAFVPISIAALMALGR